MFDRIEWLEGPPEAEWNGVLFANEVIDALPTPRLLRDSKAMLADSFFSSGAV